LEIWQSDDGAPRVDYLKSDLINNVIVITGRPPILLGPEKQQNMPKTTYIDEEVSKSSSGPEFVVVKGSSEDEEEEVSEEEVPNRNRTMQKQGQKGKAKGIVIKERVDVEAPKRSQTLEQHKGKGKAKAVVLSESETESEEIPRKKGLKKGTYLLALPSHHLNVNPNFFLSNYFIFAVLRQRGRGKDVIEEANDDDDEEKELEPTDNEDVAPPPKKQSKSPQLLTFRS
jgi:hypothetical protein